jgi:hypothetical protein
MWEFLGMTESERDRFADFMRTKVNAEPEVSGQVHVPITGSCSKDIVRAMHNWGMIFLKPGGRLTKAIAVQILADYVGTTVAELENLSAFHFAMRYGQDNNRQLGNIIRRGLQWRGWS